MGDEILVRRQNGFRLLLVLVPAPEVLAKRRIACHIGIDMVSSCVVHKVPKMLPPGTKPTLS